MSDQRVEDDNENDTETEVATHSFFSFCKWDFMICMLLLAF